MSSLADLNPTTLLCTHRLADMIACGQVLQGAVEAHLPRWQKTVTHPRLSLYCIGRWPYPGAVNGPSWPLGLGILNSEELGILGPMGSGWELFFLSTSWK